MLSRRRLAAVAGLAAAAALAVAASQAGAIATTCAVNASGGFINCLALGNPSVETAKADQATGTPYRFQLYRFSDGARWGWWQWSDTNYHFVTLALSGVITGQIDNLGSGNPNTYYVQMN
jgi:hypothetical protein